MNTHSRIPWGALWAALAATAVTSLAWASVTLGAVLWLGREHQFAALAAVMRALITAFVAVVHATSPAWFAAGLMLIGVLTLAVDQFRRENSEVFHG
jgi:hypothetical protein